MHCISHKTLSSSPLIMMSNEECNWRTTTFHLQFLEPQFTHLFKASLFDQSCSHPCLCFLSYSFSSSHLSFLFHDILHNYFTFNPLKPFLSCHDLSILFGFPSVGRCVVSHDEMNPLFIIRVMFCVFIMKGSHKKGASGYCLRESNWSFFLCLYFLTCTSFLWEKISWLTFCRMPNIPFDTDDEEATAKRVNICRHSFQTER